MYAEISAAIQSVKTVSDLAKAANSLTNHNELMAAVADVNAKLMDATAVALAGQEKHSELLNKIKKLEDEISHLREKNNVIERYQLHKFTTGALAYVLKEVHEQNEPSHYLCVKCVDDGGITKLQPCGSRRLKCITCNYIIQTEYDPPLNLRRSNSDWRLA